MQNRWQPGLGEGEQQRSETKHCCGSVRRPNGVYNNRDVSIKQFVLPCEYLTFPFPPEVFDLQS